jgi:hypothetical protein
LLDSVLSNTVGVAFRAVSGNVDPWTLQQQKDDAAAAAKQALGPNATPEAIAQAQAAAESEIDVFLKTTDSHPDQAGLRLPGLGVVGSSEFLQKLEKIVNVSIAVLAVGTVVYFAVLYRGTLGKQINKLKKAR